ncbi:MAG TPA: response regulator transcription factor [Gemmatimonadales bacterium]|nr:response regulator transcription factor [Gemmatimonadales bacterium]
MIRIVIADDHPIVRAGFRQLVAEDPQLRVVAEAGDTAELLTVLAAHEADVVLLDISMPGIAFLDLVQRIRATRPRARILVVSMHPEDQVAVRAIEAGADGYVMKTQSADELVGAIRKVHAGGKHVGPALAERLAAELAARRDGRARRDLSAREREILMLLGSGKSLKEIGARLTLSPKTVSTYRSRILTKLALKTNADLVRYVIEQGLTA